MLRAIIELVANQAGIARRSIDRLWESAYIDTADEWAVPYIGDLVATRLLSALNLQGRRADVAKTIFTDAAPAPHSSRNTDPRHRPLGLAVVEAFKRLARTRHGIDPGTRVRCADR